MPKTIEVTKAFTLTRDDGTSKHYEQGVHRGVDDDEAAHWYVKAHTKAAAGPEPEAPTRIAKK